MRYPATPPATSPISQDQDQQFSQLKERYKGCHACGVYSTPLWRRGPFGLKTLCNSCGLKYSQGKSFLVRSNTALAAAGFDGEMINKSVKVHQRMYIKDEDEPNVILRKQFSPRGNVLGQTLLLNKTAKQLFPAKRFLDKNRLTREKRLNLLLEEDSEEETLDDHGILDEFVKSVHKRRSKSGPSSRRSDNGFSS